MRDNKRRKNSKSGLLQKCLIILFWLCIWQLAAALTHNNILFVSPMQAGRAFVMNIIRADFWKIVAYSLARVGGGFFLALFMGLILGALAYKLPFIEALFAPLMMTVKSVPVASFVVLLLIWFGSERLSLLISFLVVLPNVYVNTIAGLRSADIELLEMADVFHISGVNRFFYIYKPALMPCLMSCLKISLGMSWKSGVAAEIIGMPRYSIGERLYMSKIYLDTAGLFSWTLVVILLSFIFEKAVLYLVKRFDAWHLNPVRSRRRGINGTAGDIRIGRVLGNIRIENVCKAYGGKQVIDGFSYTIEPGGRYCLTAPSGAGKTTLLKLLNRIEQPDSGIIEGVPKRIGMVFQEDRLCEGWDALANIMLTAKATADKQEIFDEACRILPKDCLDKPVSGFSGGMKRRCAILRAMLSASDIIIMDEPFNGLDAENRRRTASYILEKLGGRTLIITSHRDEDIGLLGGVKIELKN